MKKKYYITVFTKWEMAKGYKKAFIACDTEEEQTEMYQYLSDWLYELVTAKKLIDYTVIKEGGL